MTTVCEILAFECSSCRRRYFERALVEACVEACTLQKELEALVAAAGVEKAHDATIAIGPWPEGTDPPCAPGVRVAVRWVAVDGGRHLFSGWGTPRDGEVDVRPELAAEYTLLLFRMMEARAHADGLAYVGVRAARTT